MTCDPDQSRARQEAVAVRREGHANGAQAMKETRARL